MITLPDRIKNDLSGNLTSAEYLVAIKTDPVIYISTTKQMFDATEGDVYGGNLISNGTFNSSDDWVFNEGWELDTSNNYAYCDMTDSSLSGYTNSNLQQHNIVPIGHKYKIQYHLEKLSSEGGIRFYIGGTIHTGYDSQTGDYEHFIEHTGVNETIALQATGAASGNGAFKGYVDNVKVYRQSPTYYEDIDLKLSNIKEKIDLKTKKIQLSSMSLTFSNFPINEVRLSDKLGNGLGKEISVYLKTASCETLEDCIKVADLKVNRYNHDRNTVKINADDKWLESFYIDLPREEYVLDKEQNTFENYHLKPVPILYGRLENAPAIPYKIGAGNEGIAIIPDTSYFTSSDSEIGGIKYFDSNRQYDEMVSPNVLKIKLGEDMCDVLCRPYVNSRAKIHSKLNYPQYETKNDYIRLHLMKSGGRDTLLGRYNALWCSANKSATLSSGYTYFYLYDNNSYDGAFWIASEQNNRELVNIETASGGYTNWSSGQTSDNAWSAGTQVFKFDPLSQTNVVEPDEDSPEDQDTYIDSTDCHLLGNGVFNINTDDNLVDYNNAEYLGIYGVFNAINHDNDIQEYEVGSDIGNVAGFNFIGLYYPDIGNLTDDWNRLRMLIKIQTEGGAGGGVMFYEDDQFISYFNSGRVFNNGNENDDNSMVAFYRDDNTSSTLESNALSLYYTAFLPSSYGYTSNPNTRLDLEASWDDMEVRKTWANADVFKENFFVNAKGRVGYELVGSKSINAEIKVWYEGENEPTSEHFTHRRSRHLSLLYKFLTGNKYRTKIINGETYELMLYSQNLDDENLYIFDIDVNNFYASSDMTTDLDPNNEYRPYIIVDGDDTDYFQISDDHNVGWLFEITAKIFGNHTGSLDSIFLVYGKKNIVNGVLESITPENDDLLNNFNIANGGSFGMPITGYTKIYWDEGGVEENPKEILEQPEDIIKDLVSNELKAGSVQIPEQTHSKFGFSINEQENSKDIIENICSQSELFFRYSPRDGHAIVDKIKKQYTQGDVDKTIETDRILKYSFNKTKIDDLCFGGCRVKWGWDYGKEEAIGVTEDIVVIDEFMDKYLTEYGVEDSEKYQLEVEAPYINNEATAEKFRDFLFQFYKNTHLTLKLTLALQDGIELEVGDIVAFDKDIGGLKPYGKSIVSNSSLPSNNGDQVAYPYFIITSVSKSLSKVDIEVMQLHNLLGTPVVYGCTIEGYENYNELANVDDGSCNYEIVYGCTIEGSQNYDPLATHNDGSCIPPDPIAPVAQYDTYIYDEDGNTATIPFAGYQIVLVSNSYDEDGTIESYQWSMVVAESGSGENVDIPYSLQNDLDYANGGGGLGILILNTTYDHIGLHIGVQLTVTDNDGMTGDFGATTAVTPILDPELEITGDVNNDYSVDVIDVVAVVNHILGNDNLVGVSLYQADVTGDGIIDVLDIVGLVNIIMGDTE